MTCTLVSSRGGGPDDTRRYLTVIRTLLSSRGGGPEDMRRQNLVIPHPFAIKRRSSAMAHRDKLFSFCTFCHPGGRPDDMRGNLMVPQLFRLLSSRDGGSNDMRGNLMVPHPFYTIQRQSSLIAHEDKLWSSAYSFLDYPLVGILTGRMMFRSNEISVLSLLPLYL